jgi:hypothetical protein
MTDKILRTGVSYRASQVLLQSYHSLKRTF